jgi:hypothetical protein
MGRAPDRAVSRKHSITSRMDDAEVADLDAGGAVRGGMDRSTYIRWLIQEDKKRIAREQSALRGVKIVSSGEPAPDWPRVPRGGLQYPKPPAFPAELEGDL